MNMPVMDGYEALSIMKRRKWLDRLPVIVISAEIGGESVRKAYELGASDYLYVHLMNLLYLEEFGILLLSMITFQAILMMR